MGGITLSKTFCVLGLVLLAPFTQAQEKKHKIDQWLESQLEKNHSTAGMCDALHQAGVMWDKQMNASYKYLIGKLNAEHKADLQKSQRAWIAFRDAESKVQGILVDPYFGTMGRVDAANEYYEMVKSRSQTLAIYESRIREMHDDEAEVESNNDASKVKVIAPKRGSQLRKDICNVFRVPMTKEVNGQKIVFVIHKLNVMGDLAFINCSLQLANGKEVDWSKTKYKNEAVTHGVENNAAGLVKKDASGKWSVVEHSFNHTDVVWLGWIEKHGIAAKLFE